MRLFMSVSKSNTLMEQKWEYTAKYNAINYIIHFYTWETSAYIFKNTALHVIFI